MTTKPKERPLKTLDELEELLNKTLQQPTIKEVSKMAVEIHGHFHRVFGYHEANPDEPFDRERFAALSRRLMKEAFGIEVDEGGEQ